MPTVPLVGKSIALLPLADSSFGGIMPLYPMRKFVAPEFIFGVGARHRVGFYAQHLQARRILIVTDPGVIRAGWLAELQDDLAAADLLSVVFSEVMPNPKDYAVMAGAQTYHDYGCDVLVALGGGSVIDCAKGIGIVAANGGHILDFEGVDRIPRPGPPLICIPTTAGTAADISQFAIINNTDLRYKIAIISKSVVPDVALVDPETTLTMDPYLTACTGIDALVHAIEAYVSTASSPVMDTHALAAIELIRDNLPLTIADPTCLAARENMMLASLQAGLAFSNASLGAVHALSHSLGGYLDLPHGESNALLLEHVIRFNYPTAVPRYQRIGQALGIDMAGVPEARRETRITEAVRLLRTDCGIHDGLTQRGISYSEIADLAPPATRDACLFTNPRRVSLADIKTLYAEAL
jgi:alcohol dehydrogenase class IV